MDTSEKVELYYNEDHSFKDGIALLRNLAKQTVAEESYKWNFPVYTLSNKNVFGICRFKNHFGVWFFNGVLLSDPKKVLQNAQEGKTKGMRHWKFSSIADIEEKDVVAYMREALENQMNGLELKVEKKNSTFYIPELLEQEMDKTPGLKEAFEQFSTYKQREFCEYIAEAKLEKTKMKRLKKIIPMIQQGIGLNDKYR